MAVSVINPSTSVGQYNATPPTLTDGDTSGVQLDSAGNLKVAIATGGVDQDVNIAAVGGNAVTTTVPVSTTPKTTSPYTVAAITTASSGDNTIVSATAAQTIRVYRVAWTLAAGSLTFKDGAATSLSGAMSAASGVLEDPMGNPVFVMSTNTAFVINLSGANQLSGTVWYTKS